MDEKPNNSFNFLFPKNLSIGKVIAPLNYKREIIKVVESLGEIEPIMVDPRTGIDQVSVEERRASLETLRNKLNIYIAALNKKLISKSKKVDIVDTEEGVLNFVKDVVDNKGKDLEKITSRIEEVSTNIKRLEEALLLLDKLNTLDIPHTILSDTYHTKTFFGSVFPAQVQRLLWMIDEITQGRYIFLDNERNKEESIFLLVVLKDDGDIISDRLKTLNVQEIIVPSDIDLEGLNRADGEAEILKLKEEDIQLTKKLDKFSSEMGHLFNAASEVIEIELQRISIELKMRRTRTTCVMWAWMPDKLKSKFESTIYKATEGSATFDFREGDFDPQFSPTYLTANRYSKPMVGLVTAFGTPGKQEINPLPFVSILFPLLFGIMFADVGHGIILMLFGFYAGHKKKSMTSEQLKGLSGYIYGSPGLLVRMGAFAAILGIPFNSFLGDETFIIQKWTIFKPLFNGFWHWMYKINDTTGHIQRNYLNFLILSFIVGAIVITLGLILNIIQMKKYAHSKTEFNASVTLFAIYFFILVGVIMRVLSLPSIVFTIFILLSLACIVLTLGIEFKGHGIDGLMLGFDHVLSLMSNTFSFGRLLAMNTIHYVIATLPLLFMNLAIQGVQNENIHHWVPSNLVVLWMIGSAIGALIVVPVEAVFSTLQSIRLNWVEFFGKFFKGEGIPFRPVSIERVHTTIVSS